MNSIATIKFPGNHTADLDLTFTIESFIYHAQVKLDYVHVDLLF